MKANQINLELKSKLDWSTTSDNYKKKAKTIHKRQSTSLKYSQ